MRESVSNLVIGDIAAARGRHDPLSRLSERERDVLRLTAEGRSSARLGESSRPVPEDGRIVSSRIMRKLEIRDITGLVKISSTYGPGQ